MTSLRFECGALDKKPVTIEGDWFQITYDEIRDEHDGMIAYRNCEGYWMLLGEEAFSDIVIFC